MKKTFLFSLLAMAICSSSFADTWARFSCVRAPNDPGLQYQVHLDYHAPAGSKGSHARLDVPTDFAPHHLNCTTYLLKPGTSWNQPNQTIASCDDGIKDGGYAIRFNPVGGVSSHFLANVIEKNFVRNRTVASLVCRLILN